MPDRHKSTPLSLRLPEAERERLEAYAREHGQPVRRVITEAVRRFLDQQGDGEMIRKGIQEFLAQYGDSDLPMFRVAQDLAHSTLAILDGVDAGA